MLCQTNTVNADISVVAKNNDITWTKTPNGARWETATGDQCASIGGPRRAVFNWDCSGTSSSPTTMVVTEDTDCIYAISIVADCSGSGADGAGSTGISGGWIFIIIVLVVVPIYLAGGFVYNWKVKGTATGTESLPNISFWRDFPGLVKDGFFFFKSKLPCLKSKGGEQYDEL